MARYFGGTYDAVEKPMRRFKKMAVELKEAADNGGTAVLEKTPRKPRTPSTPKSGGRESKHYETASP